MSQGRTPDVYKHTQVTVYHADAHRLARRGGVRAVANTRTEGENFSDVVKRLAGERSWSEVVGILTDEEANALDDAVAAGRIGSAGRTDRVADELTEATDDG